MKKTAVLLLLLLVAPLAFAQKEKIRGSRNVTTSVKEIPDFDNIEIEDNLDVFLQYGDKCELEIEADDNTHDAIIISSSGGALRISTSKDVTSAKKFSVKITYTNSLKLLVAKEDVNITALTDLKLDDFTFKISGSAKVFANVRGKVFTLMANDKAKAELNIVSESATVELSKNSQLKALISSSKLNVDMYQKAIATVEGDVTDLKLRLDNNTNFTGKNLAAKNADIIAEDNANISIAVSAIAGISASGKSEIDLHGEQSKIEIRKFSESAAIRKRPLK
jgi:putative alpha-1,2-mannosidase